WADRRVSGETSPSASFRSSPSRRVSKAASDAQRTTERLGSPRRAMPSYDDSVAARRVPDGLSGGPGLGGRRRPAPTTYLVEVLGVIDRRLRVGLRGGRAPELGLGQDLVPRLVDDVEESAIRLLLLEGRRRPEPEVEGVHEAEEVADRGVLD